MLLERCSTQLYAARSDFTPQTLVINASLNTEKRNTTNYLGKTAGNGSESVGATQ